MRLTSFIFTSGVIVLALAAQSATAIPSSASSHLASPLQARGGCSGGVHVCCGSSSVGCSGNACKACCGNTCGCFYERGGTCSSDPSVSPCVDVTKPDFAMTNGQCIAPRGGSSGGSTSSGGSSGTKSSFCSSLPPRFARIFGC